jgi:Family of unknown function (DUF6445)
MPATPLFNPRPTIDVLNLSNGASCLVVDDALLDPDQWLQFAVSERDAFRPVDFNAFPGSYRLLPQHAFEALRNFFLEHVRKRFDARRVLTMHARYSMVTLPTSALRPYQWICHSDNADVRADQSIQASVLYLFKDAGLGGTSFYEPKRAAEDTARFFRDSTALSSDAFAQKYGIEPGYMLGSNEYFAQTGRVDARWNRMIFYDGSLLHSGDIFAPEKLTADPLHGRLTVNGFFTSRRHAA